MKDILSKEKILKYSNGKITPDNFILLETVNSTNLYCKELLKACPRHEVLVVANEQTNGRGRLGRSFFSPKSTGIYMSLIIDRNRISLTPALLTVAAGTAVCRVLNTFCNTDVSIKWVNDIFANGKKVCGILAESVSLPKESTPKYIIIGIGINISTSDNIFPDELKTIAGSVFPKSVTRNEIIAHIVNELHDIYIEGNIDKLINEYKTYSLVLGKKISFTQNGRTYVGTATDINSEGNLVVKLNNNETVYLKSGEISLGSENFTKNA